jgi:threonine dehydrogenase-like Zn-dependent dehydrogenase
VGKNGDKSKSRDDGLTPLSEGVLWTVFLKRFKMGNMKAAFLNKPKQLTLKEVKMPEPKVGEVRIKLKMIGVCGSDVHLFQGHRLLAKQLAIGHEGLGYIDKIGKGVTGREIGERVVIEPNIPCHKCRYCVSGRGNICINKRVIGVTEMGCFAEYICLPAEFCWKVPDTISDNDAVAIEPTAVAVHALLASKAKIGDTIAMIGLGAIGLLLTHLALALGYKVFVSEINENKLKMATDLGAIAVNFGFRVLDFGNNPQSSTPNPKNTEGGTAEEQGAFLNKIWSENDVVAVFECAGSAFTASLATAAAPRGSEIVLVGLSEKLATFTPLKIAREGITIVPSIIYDHPFDFKRTIQLIEAKIIRPSFIVSRYVPLHDIQNALEIAAKGEDSKIVVTIDH